MYKKLLNLLLLSISISVYAKEGKIYYDLNWEECLKEQAEWYRLYTKEAGLYKIEDHYADGPLYMTGYRSNIKSNQVKYREGLIVFYDKQGHKTREGEYKNGLRVGPWKFYYRNSDAIRTEIHYPPDSSTAEVVCKYDSVTHLLKHKSIVISKVKSLNWQYKGSDSIYYETVNDFSNKYEPFETITYNGESITVTTDTGTHVVTCYDKEGQKTQCPSMVDTAIYAERMPKALYGIPEYLSKNIRYPNLARSRGIDGKVITKFIIDEDGAVTEAMTIKGIGGGCDEESVRVISKMPNWQPGIQYGYPVRVFFTLPITFKLE